MSHNFQKIADRYICGNGQIFKDTNPSTGEILAQLKTMTITDLFESIERASEAFDDWSSYSSFQRGTILLKAGELMEQEASLYSELMTLEEGKTLKDSRLEVMRSYNTLKFYGVIAMKHGGKTIPSANKNTSILTIKEPLGTVALITPWNFPLSIPVWKMAPALAAGNSIVIKPASNTPLIVAKLIDTLMQAGLPENVVKIAVGSGRDIGNKLVKDDRIDAISFTGSVPVGRNIYKVVGTKSTMTRTQLELGGKNAMYVDEFADLNSSVKNAIMGAFALTGQSCTATSRLLVHGKIYDELIRKLTVAASSWQVGDGMSSRADMGPVVDEEQLKTDLEYVEIGKKEGAELIVGKTSTDKQTLFLNPIIFEHVSPDMRIFKEEIFGPILGITKVDNLDEAIDLVNSVPFGHTSAIMTSNLHNAMEFVRRVDAGVLKVNNPTVGLELQAPFGAFKGSGANTWKEMGEEALDFYSREKTTYLGW